MAKVEAKVSIDDKFKANLLKLIDDVNTLVTYVNSHGYQTVTPIMLSLGREVIAKYDSAALITLLAKRSHLYWEQIRNRDEKFFGEQADEIFKELSAGGKVELFKALFNGKKADGTLLVGPANRGTIWFTIHKMVRLMLDHPQIESMLTAAGTEAKMEAEAAVAQAKSIIYLARKAWGEKR